MDFDIQMDHLILDRWPDQVIVNKNRELAELVDFAIPADLRLKLMKDKKKDKFLDLARELKKQWNMIVTVILIVIRVLSRVSKGLVKGQDEFEKRT